VAVDEGSGGPGEGLAFQKGEHSGEGTVLFGALGERKEDAPGDPGHDGERGDGKRTVSRIESLYRKFYGEAVDRHKLLLNIIWMEFARRIKRPLFILLIVFSWIGSVVFYTLLLYFAQLWSEEFEYYDVVNEEFTRGIFMASYDTSFFFLVIFAAFVGGKLFSQAFADKTIILYLTKPVSKTEFLLSRLGIVALTLSLVSLLPVVTLYFIAVAITFKSFAWFIDNFWLLAAVVGYGLLVIITFSNISLAFSCLTKRVYWAMASVIIFVSLSEALGFIVAEITGSEYGILITVWENLRVIGHVIFQLDLPYDVNWLFSLFVVGVVNAVCFAIVFWKVAVLEVE